MTGIASGGTAAMAGTAPPGLRVHLATARIPTIADAPELWYLRTAQEKAQVRKVGRLRAPDGTYTVRPGDSLSSIAAHAYGKAAAWPVIYWRNRAHVRWADVLTVAQVLALPPLPAHIPAAPAQLAPLAPPPPAAPGPSATGPSAVSAPAPAAAPVSGSGVDWYAVAQCESGGNWSISTGNGFSGGLQFTQSTWDAYGGAAYAPSAGQASASQQIAVANRVLAGQGIGAWPVCGARG